MTPKTLRELELEHDIVKLQAKIIELSAKIGPMEEYHKLFTLSKPQELITSSPLQMCLTAAIGAEAGYSDETGWEVIVWGYPKKPGDKFECRYYFSDNQCSTHNLPFYMARLHEQFQYQLLAYILKNR